jgi:hypothetical protein
MLYEYGIALPISICIESGSKCIFPLLAAGLASESCLIIFLKDRRLTGACSGSLQ